VFSWQNLLVEPLNRFEPKHMVRDTNFVYIREKKSGKDYAMRYPQRYRIKEWTLLRKRP
jgi:hypothetical protein